MQFWFGNLVKPPITSTFYGHFTLVFSSPLCNESLTNLHLLKKTIQILIVSNTNTIMYKQLFTIKTIKRYVVC